MAAKDDPVIDLVEEEEEEWPEVGAQNPEEAEWYTERINNVFDHLSELIHQDTKMALGQTIQNFKKIVGKAVGRNGGRRCRCRPQDHQRSHCSIFVAASDWWGSRGRGSPPKNCQQGRSFYGSYQNGPGWAEEKAFIVDIFNHTAQAHGHLLEVCANVSALAKVTDKATLLSVINGAVCLLVQLNIPEGFLNPVEDKKAKTTEEEKREKV